MPQDVIDRCTVEDRRARAKRVREQRAKRMKKSKVDALQGSLSSVLDPGSLEEEEAGHQNLRRGLKAEAMQFGIPTQLVWPRTLRLTAALASPGQRTQDVATRAWNFTLLIPQKPVARRGALPSLSGSASLACLSIVKCSERLRGFRHQWRRHLRRQVMDTSYGVAPSNGTNGDKASRLTSTSSWPPVYCAM